jgi:hypothetical protein
MENYYIFRNDFNYLILYNFGAIGEYEYQQKIISKIKEYILNIRVIQIPETGDRRFMIFISIFDKFPFRVKFGNIVNINFASDVDNYNDDWHNKIAEPVSFEYFNNFTILITRL